MWEENIQMHLKDIGGEDMELIRMAQERTSNGILCRW